MPTTIDVEAKRAEGHITSTLDVAVARQPSFAEWLQSYEQEYLEADAINRTVIESHYTAKAEDLMYGTSHSSHIDEYFQLEIPFLESCGRLLRIKMTRALNEEYLDTLMTGVNTVVSTLKLLYDSAQQSGTAEQDSQMVKLTMRVLKRMRDLFTQLKQLDEELLPTVGKVKILGYVDDSLNELRYPGQG